MSLWQASRLLFLPVEEEVMATWVVCAHCFEALEGVPGSRCSQCGNKLQKTPLIVTSPVEPSKDSRTRLCPYCRVKNALHTYPGGFKSCADQRCKVAALDDAMEAE